MQAGDKIKSDGAAHSQEFRPLAPNRSPFVTQLLPEHAARLAVLQGGGDRLLSVREAAQRLGLCTATIYGLCADGALPHIRILERDPDRTCRPDGVHRGEAPVTQVQRAPESVALSRTPQTSAYRRLLVGFEQALPHRRQQLVSERFVVSGSRENHRADRRRRREEGASRGQPLGSRPIAVSTVVSSRSIATVNAFFVSLLPCPTSEQSAATGQPWPGCCR